jgi:hypothetical protein
VWQALAAAAVSSLSKGGRDANQTTQSQPVKVSNVFDTSGWSVNFADTQQPAVVTANSLMPWVFAVALLAMLWRRMA